MLAGDHNQTKSEHSRMPVPAKARHAWKTRAYPVPMPTRSGFRWKASALRGLPRWMGGLPVISPATVVVPALYNSLPAESIAMGWLNEIDALTTIRQRMVHSSKVTGWDVFTFHTLHNLDHFFDSTIAAVRETWVKEGNLSVEAIAEAKRRFGKPYDYYRIQPRLVENLVFQSSLLDWLSHRAADVPLRYQVVGTSLISALVWSGALSFDLAVKTAASIGERWDRSLDAMAHEESPDDRGWRRFEIVRRLLEGRLKISLAVAREDLPRVNTPVRPFWYCATASDYPVLIETAHEASAVLETLNIASWSAAMPRPVDDSVRGWLVSPLNPAARACRWSFSNYLLATPSAATLFLDHIAPIGRAPVLPVEPPRKVAAIERLTAHRNA
jgi:hypothetical protein